ncbi:MAG: YeeE/YedE thiosulfate transporter family protein [Gammaproteobacteria bacterium]|nr:YeeE/YedE thiosulfate transporter family protein [Gammaproteobacteria bacterium]
MSLVFVGDSLAASKRWWAAAVRDSGQPRPTLYLEQHGIASMLEAKNSDRAVFEKLVMIAERGDATAKYVVAIAYLSGVGISQNRVSARRWLGRSADQGNARAREVLDGDMPYPHVFVDDPSITPQVSATASAESPQEIAPVPEPVPAPTSKLNRKSDTTTSQAASDDLVTVLLNAVMQPADSHFWVWWLGGLSLGLFTVGFWVVTGNTLGVSSSWDRIVSYREDRKLQAASKMLASASDADIERAMMEATLAEFGDDLPEEFREQAARISQQQTRATPRQSREQRAPYGAHVMFLLCMAIGGTIAAYTVGDLEIRMDMGKDFIRFFGDGPGSWVVLLVGGFLIGFGTRMGGGCTSGHALSGCSRLQVGSLVATASFFGMAILVSLLLDSMFG